MSNASLRYLPFLQGTYSTAPGLISLDKATNELDRNIFQIDSNYHHYLDNKKNCREENILKYYCESRFAIPTRDWVNHIIIDSLLREHPDIFAFKKTEFTRSLYNNITREEILWDENNNLIQPTVYQSLFDALCCQVQEDIAVVQLTDDGPEYLTAIHLCSPNHWAPGDKIGNRFDKIHDPVPGMEKVMAHYPKMLANIVHTKGAYTRFAWGIATDIRLNHHPTPPPGISSAMWYGRTIEQSDQVFHLRVERQNLIGLPEANAFIFTIRTYFYSIDTLTLSEKDMLKKALLSMTVQTQEYKGIKGHLEVLLEAIDRN